MNQLERDEILNTLLKMSDQQFDSMAKDSVRKIIGNTNENALVPILYLLDDCVHGSLCSNFEIKVLNLIYDNIGGSENHRQSLMTERENRFK